MAAHRSSRSQLRARPGGMVALLRGSPGLHQLVDPAGKDPPWTDSDRAGDGPHDTPTRGGLSRRAHQVLEEEEARAKTETPGDWLRDVAFFQRNVNHTAASLLTPGPLAAARRTRAIRARYLNQRCAGGTERKRPCGRCMTVATSGGRLRKAGGSPKTWWSAAGPLRTSGAAAELAARLYPNCRSERCLQNRRRPVQPIAGPSGVSGGSCQPIPSENNPRTKPASPCAPFSSPSAGS